MRVCIVNRVVVVIALVSVAALACVATSMLVRTAGGQTQPLDRVIVTRLNMIFSDRALALVEGAGTALASHYDLDSKYGRWALDREERRIRYVQAWGEARGVQLVGAAIELRIDSADVAGDTARIGLKQSADFAYTYVGDLYAKPDHFGIGTRHFVELIRKGGTWVIRRDWYTDPLDEDSAVADVRPASMPQGAFRVNTSPPPAPKPDAPLPAMEEAPGERRDASESRRYAGYDRDGAARYADKYCGCAWGCGNNREYNAKYKDYTGLGGDCTNFVSQVLGDSEGGGFRPDWAWRYVTGGLGAGPSRAWAQAGALVSYLLASGRAARIARGTYQDVVIPSEKYPHGAIGALGLGDLMAYEERGRIEHLAVVTGTDSHGYVVVNSHTADRYHVPWDIGWDRSTIFWVIHIHS